MYSRTYKAGVTIPPLLWVTVFLLVPYVILFCYSFWSVSSLQVIVHTWTLQNYVQLVRNPIYLEVLFRSMRIAGGVTLCALLLGYPLAYYLSFHAAKRKDLLYQLVIIPLWASLARPARQGKLAHSGRHQLVQQIFALGGVKQKGKEDSPTKARRA